MLANASGEAALSKEITETIERYCRLWREMDSNDRLRKLSDICSEDVRYCDPGADVSGTQALAGHIEATLAKMPGSRIIMIGRADYHHNMVRFGWCLERADGSHGAECIDFAELSEHGRLKRITGFFGPLPPV